MKRWMSRAIWMAAIGLLGVVQVVGCYTPREYREKAMAAPDPRQEQAEKMWSALMKVAEEESWELDIARPQDLILTTAPLQAEDKLRKRIRFLIIKTPFAVGLNVTVKFEREAGDAVTGWEEARTPELSARSKREEQVLAKRVYTHWEAAQ